MENAKDRSIIWCEIVSPFYLTYLKKKIFSIDHESKFEAIEILQTRIRIY